MDNYKIVNFEWCKECEHWKLDEAEDVCNDCLNESVRINSERPVRFKAKEE